MKFLDKLNNVLDKLYTNQESMIYFYIALGALAAILILLIIITSIRIKKTQKKINKSDEVVVETGTPNTEETPEVKLETTEVKKEEPVVAEPVITEVPTTKPIKEETKEEEPAYKSEVTIKQEETPTEVQTENTVEPVIEPVIETVKEEPVVSVTEELPEIELPKITETSEDEISKLINSNEEPEVITDAPISVLPIEEPKPEEPKLEQTQTLDDLRNRLNNIRHK